MASAGRYAHHEFEFLFAINDDLECLFHDKLRGQRIKETYFFHGLDPIKVAEWGLKYRSVRWPNKHPELQQEIDYLKLFIEPID